MNIIDKLLCMLFLFVYIDYKRSNTQPKKHSLSTKLKLQTLVWEVSTSSRLDHAGPILESKGMGVIFQKNGKECWKRTKYLKIWAKIYKIWKYFEKGQVIIALIKPWE